MTHAPPVVSAADVAAEARALSRFLADVDPSPLALAHYARLRAVADAGAGPLLPVDRALLSFAARGAGAARIADAYARFFRPRGVLRRRVVLMFAILENSPEGEATLNAGFEGAPVMLGLRLVRTGVRSMLALAVGVLLFAPRQLAGGAPTGPVQA